jgi:hypothetical protein
MFRKKTGPFFYLLNRERANPLFHSQAAGLNLLLPVGALTLS